MLRSINPATGIVIKEYDEYSYDEVNDLIKKVNVAQARWKETSFQKKTLFLNNLAKMLEQNKKRLSELMALEMGKPLAQGESEIEKCVWLCSFYADKAESFLRDEHIKTNAYKSYVTFQPLGIILSIMPWNFPFWQVLRFAAPALLAGNGVVLKHSENTTGCALEIENMISKSGFPSNLFRSIIVDKSKMKPIIQHSSIAAITFTGSTQAGSIVAAQAGEKIKKTVLELGGSDPYIVLEDADLEYCAEICAKSRLLNSGQTCIAAKRFIVIESIYDEFVHIFKSKLQKYKVGNPCDNSVDVGPLARFDLRDELHRQVTESVKAGAVIELGCKITTETGAFYPISLLRDVKSGMPAYEEELFGPVAAIIKVANEEEAIFTANDTSYGLGAAIFSKDVSRAETIAATQLQAGCCFVNTMVKSDPRLPFGGIKNSGYGRELGVYGIQEFVNVKTVWVD